VRIIHPENPHWATIQLFQTKAGQARPAEQTSSSSNRGSWRTTSSEPLSLCPEARQHLSAPGCAGRDRGLSESNRHL